MAKYSLEFKLKAVREYLSGTIGLDPLAKKYNLKSNSPVRKRINTYQALGLEDLNCNVVRHM